MQTPAIALVMCVWGRAWLTRCVMRHYERLAREFKHKMEIIGCIIQSPNDPDPAPLERGFWNYVEVPNDPLTEKWNRGFRALRQFESLQGAVMIGSDDLLNEAYFDWISRNFDVPYAELTTLHFVEPSTRRGCFVKPHRVGCGRWFSREYLEDVNYTICGGEPRNRLIDASVDVVRLGAGVDRYEIDAPGVVCADVKTSLNLWSYDEIVDRVPRSHRVMLDDGGSFLLEHFPGFWQEYSALALSA